ncbi:MAG: polysaccharide deacetylase family protein [Clostridia bacterium]
MKSAFDKIPAISVLVLSIYIIFVLSVQIMPVLAKATRKTPIYSVDTCDKKVAITFDAAYGADKTVEIMDICDSFNIKATFFLVGFWVEKYPDITKLICQRGFEIGTHSQTHPNLPRLDEKQIRLQLSQSIKLINETCNAKVSLFRAPFGDYDNKLISICESMKIIPIQWDVDTLDWKGISAAEINLRVMKYTKKGSIILCHNNSKHITQALPLIIGTLQSQGYSFTTVGNLIYNENYTIDPNGRQYLNVA